LDAEEREKFRLRVSCLLRVIFLLSGDKLRKILRDQRILRDHGRVVWGYLVQANEVMFDPTNTQTVPGNAIYCTDPDADDQVVLFQGVASGLFGLKGTTPRDIDLTRFSEAITNETARTMRLPLPRSLCRGKMAFFTTCLFQPSHLPGGYLASGVFPLVICPERTEAVMVLPARYWPEELCQIFASGA
jgi:hypothetical protein